MDCSVEGVAAGQVRLDLRSVLFILNIGFQILPLDHTLSHHQSNPMRKMIT